MSDALRNYNRGLWAGIHFALSALDDDAPADLKQLYEKIRASHAETEQSLFDQTATVATIHLLAQPDLIDALSTAIINAMDEAGLVLVHTVDEREQGEIDLGFSATGSDPPDEVPDDPTRLGSNR
ncbi:MAG: hypothetical protein R2867_05405 [Caldilineaceae bacterium]